MARTHKDPRVDAYIAAAAPFAQPILTHLRKLVHAACPGVEETIKWRMPFFTRNGVIVSGMAAFQAHCALHFWKASAVVDGAPEAKSGAMGEFGRVTSLADLPSDAVLTNYIRKAAELNEERAKSPAVKKLSPKQSEAVAVPDYLRAALQKSPRAQATFDALSNSGQKDYVVWITEAKRKETRDRRMTLALEWLEEGKPHNWKYRK